MTSNLPPLVQAFAGGVGSVAANAGTYPLDVLVTRIQTSKAEADITGKRRADPRQIIREIIKSDGYAGLYAGLASDSIATLISNFFYFYVYSYIRERLLAGRTEAASRLERIPSPTPWPYPPPKRGAPALSTGEELATGFVAGVLSRLASSPFNVVTVRLQVEKEIYEKDPEDSHHPSPIAVMRRIYKEEGILGFWKGFESTILLCSNPAITLFLFQVFRRVFLRGKDRDIPTAAQALIGGATSNAIAIALLYPLILAKTRLQAARKQFGDLTLFSVLLAVVNRKGWQGLYDGLDVQLLKGVLSQGLTLMTKQRIEAIVVSLYMLTRRQK